MIFYMWHNKGVTIHPFDDKRDTKKGNIDT